MFFVAGCILYGGCATPSYEEGAIKRSLKKASAYRQLTKAAPPESDWNTTGLWVKVGENPALYVPAEYGRTAPRDASRGRWFRDERDGKQLFVPKDGAGNHSAGTLRGEAIRITLWHEGKSLPGYQEIPYSKTITR